MFGRVETIPSPMRRSELARLIPRNELRTVELRGTLLRVRAGRQLIRQDEIGRECMVIADGTFSVTRDGEPVAQLGAGDVMGELSVITRRPRTASVHATSDSTVYVFNSREFRSLLNECPALSLLVHDTAHERSLAS